MKLWQGWHNTDQRWTLFSLWSLGGTKNRWGHCHKNMLKKHEMGNEKAEWEFLSNSREICCHFVILVYRKTVS